MSKTKVGDRVGVIQQADKDTVYLVGYGTRMEDCLPEGVPGPIAAMAVSHGWNTPCIKLDSGELIWGFEAHWGHEEYVQNAVSRRKNVIHVSVEELRRENK